MRSCKLVGRDIFGYPLNSSTGRDHVCGLHIEVFEDGHDEFLWSAVQSEQWHEGESNPLQLTSMRSVNGTRGTAPTPGRSTTIRRNPYPRARGSGGQSPSGSDHMSLSSSSPVPSAPRTRAASTSYTAPRQCMALSPPSGPTHLAGRQTTASSLTAARTGPARPLDPQCRHRSRSVLCVDSGGGGG